MRQHTCTKFGQIMATMTQPETGIKNGNHSPEHLPLHDLVTESMNEASQGFDTKSALEIARISISSGRVFL